MTYRFINL